MLRNWEERFHFVMSEYVLRTRIAGPDVMLEQLDRIEAAMTDYPNLEIRIIPMSTELPVFPLTEVFYV